MYNEPDLVDLIPAYYCNYITRRQGSCLWKTICTHIIVIIFTILICLSGFYYYQFVYLENDMIPQNAEIKIDNIPDVRFDTLSSSDIIKQITDDLNEKFNPLKKDIEMINKWRSDTNSILKGIQSQQDIKIKTAINNAIELYEADNIGLMDYAAIYAGGSVVEISSETRPYPTHRPFSLFKLVNLDMLSNPEEILRPCVLPGSCFAFWGTYGRIKIRLGKAIEVGGVSLSHSSRLLLGVDGMTSAPKEFEVHGFTTENDNAGTHLGGFEYDWMGKQHQTFRIPEKHTFQNKTFELITLTL
ncbi:hypothetical protein GWI33_004716 [Rhynchophorus ferrugineus]|uniref:SUN domain-containing protein n=1 Tax=Rhynchophorus ferrugineus TaxID=354439 RepID=A0A834IIJ2_RHYFE|nr:hypothetical protein GWI33_004716 [Rhynchophorus ferrugineus]